MWLVQCLNCDPSRGKLRGLKQSEEQLIDSFIYQDRWGQFVKSLTLIINSADFTTVINCEKHRNFFIYRSTVLFSGSVLFPLYAYAGLNPSDSSNRAWLLTEHLPLMKQLLTVSSDHTFNCCNNKASANSRNNTANRSVPPTVALQSLPGPPVCISLKF